ncbi:hypothetical protein RJT34_19621 [Clitoria ternatea]|uniref:Protein BIC1 n=1 Tax=Clitoria ternatea TaxID=43366 RepID=A0AAN9P408_CLITE
MAHQSSTESDDQIPSQPLDLNTSPPHPSQDIFNNNMAPQQEHCLTPSNHEDDDRDNDNNEDVTQSATVCDKEKVALQEEEGGREKLKRHRGEVAGRVWIPEIWGQEDFLKDWIDCTAFDAPLVPSTITNAREALVQECTRANAAGLRIDNRC